MKTPPRPAGSDGDQTSPDGSFFLYTPATDGHYTDSNSNGNSNSNSNSNGNSVASGAGRTPRRAPPTAHRTGMESTARWNNPVGDTEDIVAAVLEKMQGEPHALQVRLSGLKGAGSRLEAALVLAAHVTPCRTTRDILGEAVKWAEYGAENGRFVVIRDADPRKEWSGPKWSGNTHSVAMFVAGKKLPSASPAAREKLAW